jgi:hypothetical protein
MNPFHHCREPQNPVPGVASLLHICGCPCMWRGEGESRRGGLSPTASRTSMGHPVLLSELADRVNVTGAQVRVPPTVLSGPR